MILNGQWHFKLFYNVEDALATVGIFDRDQTTVAVPGHWQLQVLNDIPIYLNKRYAIPIDDVPNVPHYNPTGRYRKTFHISKNWSRNNRVILHFGGVDNAFYCWVNGSYVGFSKDSRLPAGLFRNLSLYWCICMSES
jgi:beta-galactosidase